MVPFDSTQLQPGDTLLYRPSAFSVKNLGGWLFGRAIAMKSWHNISHVELYAGHSESEASRDGKGVERYPLRLTELAYVLRPCHPIDWMGGEPWFASVRGEGYDWIGLSRFIRTSIVPSRTKMFCSAFWLRRLRASNYNPFATRIDADSIAPGEILDCPNLVTIWTDGRDVDYSPAAPAGVAS